MGTETPKTLSNEEIIQVLIWAENAPNLLRTQISDTIDYLVNIEDNNPDLTNEQLDTIYRTSILLDRLYDVVIDYQETSVE